MSNTHYMMSTHVDWSNTSLAQIIILKINLSENPQNLPYFWFSDEDKQRTQASQDAGPGYRKHWRTLMQQREVPINRMQFSMQQLTLKNEKYYFKRSSSNINKRFSFCNQNYFQSFAPDLISQFVSLSILTE